MSGGPDRGGAEANQSSTATVASSSDVGVSDANNRKDKPALTHNDIIVKVLAPRYTWWWRVLIKAKAWQFLVPWPLPYLLYPVLRSHFRERPPRPWTSSSGWLTISGAIWALFVFVAPENVARDEKIAGEAAKVLFSGAFLLGTILSVSVALPGQAIVKTVITEKPKAAIDFVIPFMWAFMWGISGACLLMFLPGIGHIAPVLQKVAILIGVYGAFMELHALGHTVRMYTIGLILWGRDEAKKKDADKRGGDLAAKPAEAKAKSEDETKETARTAPNTQAPQPEVRKRVGELPPKEPASDTPDEDEGAEDAEEEPAPAPRRVNRH